MREAEEEGSEKGIEHQARLERDALLLAFKVKEGDQEPGKGAQLLETGKGKETDSPPEPPEGNTHLPASLF